MSRFLTGLASATILAVALTACSGASQRPRFPEQVINRALSNAPGEAQPSKVVSTELAFARAAREDGQWTAFRQFAAPGAIIHGANGAIPAEAWLAAQADPAQAVQWAPREIWMSCDARLAISTGRFVDPTGIVGNFITVWERQSDGEYRWVYDAGAADDPQPPAREKPEPGDIIVTAMDAVKGNVTDCAKRDAPVPASPLENASGVSPDGTLAWRWEHGADGDRLFRAYWFHDGEWEPALDTFWPAEKKD